MKEQMQTKYNSLTKIKIIKKRKEKNKKNKKKGKLLRTAKAQPGAEVYSSNKKCD